MMDHLLYIESVYPYMWRSTCSCGWVGKARYIDFTALDDWYKHSGKTD